VNSKREDRSTVQKIARVRRETKVFGQSIVGRRWVAVRAFPMHLAADLCLLGFGARPLSQPPAFCVPTRKQGNRELVLESGRRMPFDVSCILRACKKDICIENLWVRFDVKSMNVLRDPIFGSSFGVETARANHYCVYVHAITSRITIDCEKLRKNEEGLVCIYSGL
jgi:hypothetical protein